MRPTVPNLVRQALAALVVALVALVAFPRDAHAYGSFRLKSTDVKEVAGAWHLYVTVELPKAPLTAHQSMKFVFTKTAVFERSLIDGHDGPVESRLTLANQTPTVESLDVDFADASGKIYKGTRFDFGLTRTRGYEAGEYKVEVRTSDNLTVGSPANLILRGDNEVVDRRTMAFNAKDKSMKKIDAVDAGAQAKNDDTTPAAVNNQGEVTPTGVATGFVPPEGMQETNEEKIQTRPSGCGCEVPSRQSTGALLFVPLLALGAAIARRRNSRHAA